MTRISVRQRSRIAARIAAERRITTELQGPMHKPKDPPPELPLDLTEESDNDLMAMLVGLTQWANYSGVLVACGEVDSAVADKTLRVFEDVALLRLMPSSEALRKREDTMTRVKAEVATDHAIQEAREDAMVAYAYRKLVAARYEGFTRDAAVVSRELTRRLEREPSARRSTRGSAAG